jgi:hypothetical protein
LEELESAERPGKSGPSVHWRKLEEFEAEFIPDRVADRAEAKRTGHWGSDYWATKAWVESFRAGKASPVDIYRALDCSLPGQLALLSAKQKGVPVAIPDPRTF